MNAESVRQAREKAYVLKEYLDDLFQWFKLNSKEEKAEMEPLDIVEETRAVFANWVADFIQSSVPKQIPFFWGSTKIFPPYTACQKEMESLSPKFPWMADFFIKTDLSPCDCRGTFGNLYCLYGHRRNFAVAPSKKRPLSIG